MNHYQDLLEQDFEDFCDKLKNSGRVLTKDRGKEFELFANECVLKDRGLSQTDIVDGNTGGEHDGGIDGFYIFMNGARYVATTEGIEELREEKEKRIRLDKLQVVFTQAKRKSSLSNTVVENLDRTFRDFFNSKNQKEDFANLDIGYSQPIVSRFRQLHEIIREARISPDLLSFEIYLCSRSEGDLTGEAKAIAERAKAAIRDYYSESDVLLDVQKASDLYKLWHRKDDCEAAITSVNYQDPEGQLIALCSLPDYFKFITDDRSVIRPALFDGNVRDFLGNRISVNKEIRSSIEAFKQDQVPFWWMNNGITVTCSSEPIRVGLDWRLKGVQIVNGLQTSHMIYDYFKQFEDADQRAAEFKRQADNQVLVKVIHVKDADSQNRIIRATNSQSAMPPASLRATDEIQRLIEVYFAQQVGGLVYDRRKGSAANAGHQASEIVQIPQLAQALLAACLYRPDTARARPGAAVTDDKLYNRIFGTDSFSLAQYYEIAKLAKIVETSLMNVYYRADVNNMIYYVVAICSIVQSGLVLEDFFQDSKTGNVKLKNNINVPIKNLEMPSSSYVVEIGDVILRYLTAEAEESGEEESKIAKGSAFKVDVLRRLYDGRTALSKVAWSALGSS